jgi:hypothetical protein
VLSLAVVAQLEHLAQDGDAAPALDRRQRVQGSECSWFCDMLASLPPDRTFNR